MKLKFLRLGYVLIIPWKEVSMNQILKYSDNWSSFEYM